MRPNRGGMISHFPAKSVIGLNSVAETSHPYNTRTQNGHFAKDFLKQDRRRSLSIANLAGQRHDENLHGWNNFTESRPSHFTRKQNGQQFMYQDRRRTMSNVNLAALRLSPNEQRYR